MASPILDVITHYQRSIEKSAHDEARLLHCIEKLYKLPVTVEHLQSTGVGKTVNSLRKYDNEVGVAAKALVAKWKTMVAAEEKDAGSDAEIKKTSYENDGENGSSQNTNLTVDNSNNIASSNHNLTSHSSSNHKSHKSNSSREGQDYVKKHKSGHDRLSSNDHGNSSHSNSNSSRKHHKSSKHDYDLHASKSSNHDNSNILENKCKTESNLNGIKMPSLYNYDLEREVQQDILDSLQDNDQSSTEYDDGEKLIIDVKVKSSETSDHGSDDDDENSEVRTNKEHHNVTSKEYKNKKEKLTKIKESNRKESSSKDKDKRNDHSHHRHHKSKHDEKKSRHDKGETKSSSSNRHKDKQKDKEKEKSKDKSSNKSSSEKYSHHAGSGTDNGSSSTKNISSNSDSKSKHKRKMSSDSDSKPTSAPSKSKVAKVLEEGIDSSMGTSFEEALGMLNTKSSSSSVASSSGMKNSSKNKAKASTSSTCGSNSIAMAEDNFIKPSSSKSIVNTPELLTSTIKLTPLDPNIALDLPTISPNYKPMPLNPTVMECVFNNRQQQSQRRTLTDEEALAAGISSKTIRTKVYSGSRPGQLQQVPSLFDLCTWVLQKNIDGLEYTGGVPFDVLKSVLELASPNQLANVEEYNPYLMEDTDVLWEKICGRHCKGVKRQEMETWREMYMRCQEEREVRLNKLTENIKQSQKQITLPIKKTQLAYIDSMVKPPRNVQRKQEQFGTSHRKVTTPAARIASLSNLSPNIAKAPENKVRINPNERDTAQASAHSRPKKAPLMQKTLQLMKGRFKR